MPLQKEPVGMFFMKCETPRDEFVCCEGTILGYGFINERDQSYHISIPGPSGLNTTVTHAPSGNTPPSPNVCRGHGYPACHWSLLPLTGRTLSKPT